MRTTIGLLAIAAILCAIWTSFQAWGRRTLLGRYEDTPGLALGRLDERKFFTYDGWRYRRVTAILYLVAGALVYSWIMLGNRR